MWKPAARLRVSKQRATLLQSWATSPTAPMRLALRSRIVLAAAVGHANSRIARELGVSRATVVLWRQRFSEEGPEGLLHDRPRGGGKPALPAEKVSAVVEATLRARPAGAEPWSVRSMAEAQGISPAAVQRIWSTLRLEPHLVRLPALSGDRRFRGAILDVVGLYRNPPENALALAVDKRASRYLDRRSSDQPLADPPDVPGRFRQRKRRVTRDRGGSLHRLEAMAVHQGRDRCSEFLRFLRQLDRKVFTKIEIHLILDNYETNEQQPVCDWLSKRSRFHLHFIPTSTLWLQTVDKWLDAIADDVIDRGAVSNVEELTKATAAYFERGPRRRGPGPFVWSAAVSDPGDRRPDHGCVERTPTDAGPRAVPAA